MRRWRLKMTAGGRVVLGATLCGEPGALRRWEFLALLDRQVDLFLMHLQEEE